MKNFALIGLAGYIAPRHLKAIKDTGNKLIVALDKNDSVGIIDSYFPEADFFTEPERFDRHVFKLLQEGNGKQVDYISICSPNYMHDAHIRLALRNDAHAICEKPLVLNTRNIAPLEALERQTGKKVYNILQLRLHPAIKALKEKISAAPKDKKYDIDLTYITGRGSWYHISWKGDESKSGGIATNIGVHFFDMLTHIFGKKQQNIVHYADKSTVGGYLELEHARVRWFLSIDANNIPADIAAEGKRTYRSITIDGETFEFSNGFTDLHTECYKEILNGNGFGLSEVIPCIDIVQEIRNASPIGLTGDFHPFLKNLI